MKDEKCLKQTSGKKDCEFRDPRIVGNQKIYVCTGTGYCPFRESIYRQNKRERSVRQRKGAR